MKMVRWAVVLGGAAALAVTAPRPASACGGFFCSQAQPVNQAAERIVFAHNEDGTITAVIEIMYEGPSESFSWLLPISSVPQGDQIAVASKISFDRLQSATNPQYSLTTRVEGLCDTPPPSDIDGSPSFGTGGSGGGSAGPLPGGGVTVEASGVVGAFEWTVISLDPALPEPATAAVTWLGDNGYDVPQGAPGLLGPYLEDGMYLLALRLQKGADTGSIRPIALTYEATAPMIPIKLTAVAANEDMGVMTWVLGTQRAVPRNYNALELNEARINWFNPNSNYNDVVIAAADEGGGQGFVTEYAQGGTMLADAVWSQFEENSWQDFAANAEAMGPELVRNAINQYSTFDGFWDVVREHVTLPQDVTIEQIQQCPFCDWGALETVPADFVAALESDVIAPARLVQELIDSHDVVTRLYTTMSAEEMTTDPLFTFNATLPDVSNIHTAERIIECGPGYFQGSAPWRIELPQGGVIRGGPQDIGQWPASFADQPANRRILRQGETGAGQVLEDNGVVIDGAIEEYSSTVPTPVKNPGSPPTPTPPTGADPNDPNDPNSPGSNPSSSGVTPSGGGGCGCGVAGANKHWAIGWAVLGLLALTARRRRSDRAS